MSKSFPPDILFCPFTELAAIKSYVIDAETLQEILEAATYNCKTASLAYRLAKIKEEIEKDVCNTPI